MKYLNQQDGNNYISNYLSNNKLVSVGRLGIVELNAIYSFMSSSTIPPSTQHLLKNNAGVYGNDIGNFTIEYINTIPKLSAHAYWDSGYEFQQDYIFSRLSPSSDKIAHRSIEPFYFDNPWSQYLKNKKILVVSPFTESIIYQYSNRINLWDNPLILPEFELVTYKNIQSINNNGPHNGWLESLDFMKNDISNIDFDIALLGCGAYGLPLVSFIYSYLNRSAIYIGGALQILFGIKGKRWDSHYEISKMYKPSWIRPSFSETPMFSQNVENGCYW